MMKNSEQLSQMVAYLAPEAAAYIRSLLAYPDFKKDKLFCSRHFWNERFLEKLLNPAQTHKQLLENLPKLRRLVGHPSQSNNPRIKERWVVVEQFLTQHGQTLRAWGAEAVLFGSLVLGKPRKADIDLQIYLEHDAMPRKVRDKIENTLFDLCHKLGADIGFSYLYNWFALAANPETVSDPTGATSLFLDTLNMSPMLYGLTLELQNQAFTQGYRRKILQVASQHPIVETHLAYSVEFALHRSLK